MKLGPKLIAAFVIVSLLSLAVGVVGLIEINNVNSKIGEITEKESPSLVSAMEIQKDITEALVNLEEYQRTTDSDDLDQLRLNFDEEDSEFLDEITNLQNLSSAADDLANIDDVITAQDTFYDAGTDYMDSYNQLLFDKEEASEHREEALHEKENMELEMKALVTIFHDKQESHLLAVEAEKDMTESLVILERYSSTESSAERALLRLDFIDEAGPVSTGLEREIADGLATMEALNPFISEQTLIDTAQATLDSYYANGIALMDAVDDYFEEKAIVKSNLQDARSSKDILEEQMKTLVGIYENKKNSYLLAAEAEKDITESLVLLETYGRTDNATERALLRIDFIDETGPVSAGIEREVADGLAAMEALSPFVNEQVMIDTAQATLTTYYTNGIALMDAVEDHFADEASVKLEQEDVRLEKDEIEVELKNIMGTYSITNINYTTAHEAEKDITEALVILEQYAQTDDAATRTILRANFDAEASASGEVNIALTQLEANETGAQSAFIDTAQAVLLSFYGCGVNLMDSADAYFVSAVFLDSALDDAHLSKDSIEQDLKSLTQNYTNGMNGLPVAQEVEKDITEGLINLEDYTQAEDSITRAALRVDFEDEAGIGGEVDIGLLQLEADESIGLATYIDTAQAALVDFYANGENLMDQVDNYSVSETTFNSALASAGVAKENIELNLKALSLLFENGTKGLPIAQEVSKDITEALVDLNLYAMENDTTELALLRIAFIEEMGPVTAGAEREVADGLDMLEDLSWDPSILAAVTAAKTVRSDYYNQGIEAMNHRDEELSSLASMETDLEDANLAKENLEETTKELADEFSTSMGQAVNEANQTVNSAIMYILAISFSAVVIGILFGLVLSRGITKPISELVVGSEAVANGDLTRDINVDTNDEIGILAQSFGTMVGNLRNLVTEILETSGTVASTSQELASSAEEMNASTQQVSSAIQQISKGSQEQADKVEETARIMKEVSASVDDVSGSAESSVESATVATTNVEEGRKAVEETVKKMQEIQKVVASSSDTIETLGDRSKEIGEIVDVITNITDQTNLLALNAAIEAARAGEQGRGFAVVADEVKALAEDSREAAERISKMIKEIQSETDKAVLSMKQGTKEVEEGMILVSQTDTSFQQISGATNKVNNEIGGISAATQQQKSGTEQVAAAVDAIASIAEESASASEESASSTEELTASMEEMTAQAQELSEMALSLQNSASQFKLADEATKKNIMTKRAPLKKKAKVQPVQAPKVKEKMPLPANMEESLLKRGIEPPKEELNGKK